MGIRKRDPVSTGFKRRKEKLKEWKNWGRKVGMGRGGCEDCVERCGMVHGRKKGGDPSSAMVTRFFKIMLFDDFDTIMFIPRKFARTIKCLEEQRVQLEDSNGNCWTVKISMFDGKLAFKQGWNKFCADHSIEMGDFLVFNYHIGSRFEVQIFDKSASEKLDFPKKSGVDEEAAPEIDEVHLPSAVQDLTPIEAPCHTNDEVSVNKEGSCSAVNFHSDHNRDVEGVFMTKREALDGDNNKSRPHVVSSHRYTEVPFYMINRNEVHEEMNRSSLFDLSNIEMVGGENAVEGPKVIEDEKSSHSNGNLIQSNTTIKESVGKRKAGGGAPPDVLMLEMPGSTSPLAQIASTLDHGKAAMENLGRSETLRGCSLMKEGHLLDSGTACAEPVSQMRHDPHGRSSVSIPQFTTKLLPEKQDSIIEGEKPVGPKVEQEEKDHPIVNAKRKTHKIVKPEAVDSVDLYCSASVVTQSFLELPTVVLPFSCRGRMESKIVLLRDPALRVWPVIYQEKTGLKVFTTGWEALAKANNIRQGDTCVISVDNESKDLYKVQITHR